MQLESHVNSRVRESTILTQIHVANEEGGMKCIFKVLNANFGSMRSIKLGMSTPIFGMKGVGIFHFRVEES